MNEFVSAKRRGRFFLLYEVPFLFGLPQLGLIGYFLVAYLGWQAMFVVGLAPAILIIPMRWFMVESPRWLLTVGRAQQASDIVARMENGLIRRGTTLLSKYRHPPPRQTRSDIRELFRGIYRPRTIMLVALWVCSYMIANGLITCCRPCTARSFSYFFKRVLPMVSPQAPSDVSQRYLCSLYRQGSSKGLVHVGILPRRCPNGDP